MVVSGKNHYSVSMWSDTFEVQMAESRQSMRRAKNENEDKRRKSRGLPVGFWMKQKQTKRPAKGNANKSHEQSSKSRSYPGNGLNSNGRL